MPATTSLSLMCRVGRRRCALPVGIVSEVLRMVPTHPVAGAADVIEGLAIVRGRPVPVVDAGRLLGELQSSPTRLVMLVVDERAVALAVDACEGIHRLDGTALAELPPLLRDAARDLVSAIEVLDGRLVETLGTARLMADDVGGLATSGHVLA